MSGPTFSESLANTAKAAAVAQLQVVLVAKKKTFLELFAHFIATEDLVELDALFQAAGDAKLRQFSAASVLEAKIAGDEYDASMRGIETLGARYEIVGKAKAGVFVRSVAHDMIAGAFAVAGAVMQAGLTILFPGGGLAGAALNIGLQHVVHHFLGD